MRTSEISKLVNIDEIRRKYDYWEDGTFNMIGFRIQEEPFSLGKIEHRSYEWIDDEQTDEVLDGICTIGIEDIENANAEYCGDHVAVICGMRGHGGYDYGELIITDPVVVEIIK